MSAMSGEVIDSARASAKKLAEALSSEQQMALETLSKGQPIRAAAQVAGVSRETVYRWIKEDAAFRAAYNAWQQEHRESCRAALLKCAEEAVARVATMVKHDHKLAFQVVKELGLFQPASSASIDPGVVQREIAAERSEQDLELDQRQVRHLLTTAEVRSALATAKSKADPHGTTPHSGGAVALQQD